MTETNNFFSNLEHAAKAIGHEVSSHPWESVLALTHLPADGGASVAQIAARATTEAAAQTSAPKPEAKPATLPHLQLVHSVAQVAQSALHEVQNNPLVAASLGPVGIAAYENHHVTEYVKNHGGAANVLSGVTRVGTALAVGAANETFNHPAEMAAAGTSGAVVNMLARVPYVNALVGIGGAAYAGYEVYKHGGEWLHNLDVTYYGKGRSATEIKNANTGLQHDGEGLALMGAGGLGAGLSGAVVSGVEGMLARRAVAASAKAAAGITDGAASENAGSEGSLAAKNLQAVGQRGAEAERVQVLHHANEDHQVIRMHSANENETTMQQGRTVNGASIESQPHSTWAEAKVGNSNQDRFVTPRDRAFAEIAREKADKAEFEEKDANFKDLEMFRMGRDGLDAEQLLGDFHFHYTAELLKKSEQDLLKLPGFSPRITAVIKEALAKKGLHLTSEVAPPRVQPEAVANSEFSSFQFISNKSMNGRIRNVLHENGITNFDELAKKFNSGELQKMDGLKSGSMQFWVVQQALQAKNYQLNEAYLLRY